MPLSRPRKILFTAAAAAGLVAGGAGLANAATTSTSTSTGNGTSTPATAGDNNDGPAYTGSVTVADTGTENANGSDTNETAQLQGLATITPDQASAAALATVPGTASTPVLENENGNVVYGVQITTPSGTVDVKVDAGNGTVLAKDTTDGNEKESANESDSGPETPDANEPGSATTN